MNHNTPLDALPSTQPNRRALPRWCFADGLGCSRVAYPTIQDTLGYLDDSSLGGFRISAFSPLPVSQSHPMFLLFEMHPDIKTVLDIEGRCRWTSDDKVMGTYQAGFQMTVAQGDTLAALFRYLNQGKASDYLTLSTS